jgi:[acyl-carrier-protein] S-malonyltransferase
MPYAVLFPGQGSQYVGMGKELFEARPDLLGDRADAVLGWSLRAVCLDGPEEELTRTDRAQPALFAVSYALWEELVKQLPAPPAATAGHSLGEYTALVAAGVIDYDTGLRLVAERGRAMAEAAAKEASGMAALLGADLEQAEQAVDRRRTEGGRLTVANINAPGQVVVAGSLDDLDWLERHAAELGVRRVVRLKVAGAFHSPFMQPAAEQVARALEDVTPQPARFPVWANVTGRPMTSSEVVDLLARQVVAPVRFAETLSGMASQGVDTFVHVGPGDVTAGMARRAAPGSRTLVVSGIDGIPQAVEALSTMEQRGG